MLTKTVRSRFNHEVGGKVEGCTIIEKRVIQPYDPVSRRLGIYDYDVEVPPAPMKPAKASRGSSRSSAPTSVAAKPEPNSFTRTTPDDMGSVIRRIPPR